MSQLRQNYHKFKALNTQVLVLVPNGPKMIERYCRKYHPPYPILSDKGSQVAEQYLQIKRFFIAGTPTVFLVNQNGQICYAHYARSLIEEPDSLEPLNVLAKMQD
jgi:peroxiredoxin